MAGGAAGAGEEDEAPLEHHSTGVLARPDEEVRKTYSVGVQVGNVRNEPIHFNVGTIAERVLSCPVFARLLQLGSDTGPASPSATATAEAEGDQLRKFEEDFVTEPPWGRAKLAAEAGAEA